MPIERGLRHILALDRERNGLTDARILNGPVAPLNTRYMNGPSVLSIFNLELAAIVSMDCQGTYSIMSRSPACKADTRRFSSA